MFQSSAETRNGVIQIHRASVNGGFDHYQIGVIIQMHCRVSIWYDYVLREAVEGHIHQNIVQAHVIIRQ